MEKKELGYSLLLLSTILLIPVTAQPFSPAFSIYGAIGCQECERVLRDLQELYGDDSIEFFDIYASNESKEHIRRSIEIYRLSFPRRERKIPLVGIFLEDQLVAIVAGERDKEYWSALLGEVQEGSVLLSYEGNEYRRIINRTLSEELAGLFGVEKPRITRGTIAGFLMLAVADSVNPCTFSVFAILLMLSMAAGGKARAARVGISFILTIYVCYYLLGLGLGFLSGKLAKIRPALVIALVGLGLFEISNFVMGVYRSPIPSPLRRLTESKLDEIGSRASIAGALTLGALLSFTLLPCSGGPYLAAVSLFPETGLVKMAWMLAIYNLIFVMPLFAILIGLYFLGLRLRTLKYWRGTRLPVMSLISGALLLALGAYLLFISV